MSIKANEILGNGGDSALAGGLGAKGTEQVIYGAWKLSDRINESIDLLKAQEFKKNRDEYEQKIKDRDAVGNLIASGQIATSEMVDDEQRLQIRDELTDLKNQFVDYAKKGGGDEGYLEIMNKYGNIKSKIDNSKTNALAIQADEKANAELYDMQSGIKNTSRNEVGKSGKNNITGETSAQTSVETTHAENIRRSSENQKLWEAHIKKQKELIAKDPLHKYQPFVPATRIDYDVAYAPIVTDEVRTVDPKNKFKVNITTTPNIKKTLDMYSKNAVDPDKRKSIERAYQQLEDGIVNLDPNSLLVVDNTNKKLMEINATIKDEKDKLPLIGGDPAKSPNKVMTMALISIAQDYDRVGKTVNQYATAEDATKDVEQFKTNQNIRQEQAANAGRMSLEKLQGANSRELAKLNASLENGKEEYKYKLAKKYSKVDGLGKKEANTKSELVSETFTKLAEKINSDDNLTDDQKISEIQKIKTALDNNTEYKVGEESPFRALAETLNRLLNETKGVSPKSNKNSENNLSGGTFISPGGIEIKVK